VRFAASAWLWGSALGALIAVVLIVQAFRLVRDKGRFGTPELIDALLTARAGARRPLRAVLLVLAVVLAALAAAAPQYGRGTRVLPATNLDVVLVLDYSKSMYAKDVSPSRMKRAKVEVARLIGELGGARFGAVAFAGDTMAFPVTSDGAAIAQFFRGLEPIDMPVGGTSIARALDTARELLGRDPLSARHERVIVLVTDGEDLEGDPPEVAGRIAADGTRIEVVQIGGRTPEPMYEVDENGNEIGLRRDSNGDLMTTFLTPEGEAQLEKVAELGGGQVVRAEKGEVGIDKITTRLQKLMTEELSERVETVYADVYHYPLGAAVLLLMLEVLLSIGPRRRLPEEPPRGAPRRRVPSRMRQAAVLLAVSCLGCQEFDRLFIRESPVVNEAIEALSSNKQKEATELLTKYLETGACDAGVIGAGERARRLGDASLDLGLALAGAYRKSKGTAAAAPSAALPGAAPGGTLPGATPPPSGLGPADPTKPVDPEASARIDCALRVLSPIAENRDLESALRARAHYLMGNLELSRSAFQAAIDAYDRAIVLAPGLPEGPGDAIGRDIARNRALAQRRLEEEERKKKEEEKKEDQKNEDQQNQDQKDQDQKDQDQKDQDQKDQDQKDQDQKDQDQKDQDQKDQDQDQKGDDKQPSDQQQPGDQQQPSDQQSAKSDQPNGSSPSAPAEGQQGQKGAPAASQDARILDRLEQAPTLQQHDAKQKARTLRLRPTMEDK